MSYYEVFKKACKQRCDAFDIRRHHIFLLFCYRPLLKNSHITPFFSFTSSSVRVKFKPEMWFYDIIMLPLLWLCLFCCPLSGRAVCFSKTCNKCYRLFSPATNQYHARRKLRLHNAPKAITRIRMIEKKSVKPEREARAELDMCLSIISTQCKLFSPSQWLLNGFNCNLKILILSLAEKTIFFLPLPSIIFLLCAEATLIACYCFDPSRSFLKNSFSKLFTSFLCFKRRSLQSCSC